MLYDNCWAIRLIAALLLTFMSHIRPVPSPQGWYGGLSPPNWNMKTTNKRSFVNFYNVKVSTGKQKLSIHNVGWFSTTYHEATTPVRMEITGVGIPGVCVIFAENLKVINAGKCSHRWHWQLARETRFVLFWWTGSTALSGLKFMPSIKCFGLLPQVHAQGARLFWLSRQSSWNFN